MKKIKWGVMGTAGIAKGCTIPGMQQAENCEMVAIAGRNPEKARQFKEEFGFQKAYGSYEELLKDPDIQAVYIALPNELHYEWIIRALEAGKHVLCEKPLAPTTEEIEKMIACANEKDLFLMEAFAYLHSPLMAAMKADLPKIGDVLFMESTFLTSGYSLSNIRMRRETFGGSVYDLGCYNTSQILWLLQEEPETVQAVSSFSPEHIDVLTTGMFTFKSGAKAIFTCGMLLEKDAGKRLDRFQVHGTNGFIRCDARFNQDGDLSYTLCVNGTVEEKRVHVPQNYRLEVEQLGRCIQNGETPFVSDAFTLQNSRLIARVLEAIGY